MARYSPLKSVELLYPWPWYGVRGSFHDQRPITKYGNRRIYEKIISYEFPDKADKVIDPTLDDLATFKYDDPEIELGNLNDSSINVSQIFYGNFFFDGGEF